MLEVEAKVDLMMKGKAYASESIRLKTRAALLRTLTSVDAIRSHEDDLDEAPNEYRNDGSDGVPVTTIEALETSQDAKRNSLRARTREFFNPDDLVEDKTGGGVGAPDINARLKWGYTLLHFAALAGDEAECDKLIAAGADPTMTDNGGKMPFQKAALKGFDALAEKLRP